MRPSPPPLTLSISVTFQIAEVELFPSLVVAVSSVVLDLDVDTPTLFHVPFLRQPDLNPTTDAKDVLKLSLHATMLPRVTSPRIVHGLPTKPRVSNPNRTSELSLFPKMLKQRKKIIMTNQFLIPNFMMRPPWRMLLMPMIT